MGLTTARGKIASLFSFNKHKKNIEVEIAFQRGNFNFEAELMYIFELASNLHKAEILFTRLEDNIIQRIIETVHHCLTKELMVLLPKEFKKIFIDVVDPNIYYNNLNPNNHSGFDPANRPNIQKNIKNILAKKELDRILVNYREDISSPENIFLEIDILAGFCLINKPENIDSTADHDHWKYHNYLKALEKSEFIKGLIEKELSKHADVYFQFDERQAKIWQKTYFEKIDQLFNQNSFKTKNISKNPSFIIRDFFITTRMLTLNILKSNRLIFEDPNKRNTEQFLYSTDNSKQLITLLNNIAQGNIPNNVQFPFLKEQASVLALTTLLTILVTYSPDFNIWKEELRKFFASTNTIADMPKIIIPYSAIKNAAKDISRQENTFRDYKGYFNLYCERARLIGLTDDELPITFKKMMELLKIAQDTNKKMIEIYKKSQMTNTYTRTIVC